VARFYYAFVYLCYVTLICYDIFCSFFHRAEDQKQFKQETARPIVSAPSPSLSPSLLPPPPPTLATNKLRSGNGNDGRQAHKASYRQKERNKEIGDDDDDDDDNDEDDNDDEDDDDDDEEEEEEGEGAEGNVSRRARQSRSRLANMSETAKHEMQPLRPINNTEKQLSRLGKSN